MCVCGLIIRSLMKERGAMKLHLSKLRIVPEKLKQIIRIGLPAGMQGAIFSVSNVLIQSSVNSFGSVAMQEIHLLPILKALYTRL